jgi:hypothetical protein
MLIVNNHHQKKKEECSSGQSNKVVDPYHYPASPNVSGELKTGS